MNRRSFTGGVRIIREDSALCLPVIVLRTARNVSIARKAVDDPNRTLALDERGNAALVPKPEAPEPDEHATETHFVTRAGWLRAAVLGANDGLLSTGSLMSGVAAAAVAPSQLVLTGVAGIVAGAMSMAAGEYMSVGSQADSERADLLREAEALREEPELERDELADIYEGRGLPRELAEQVADALMRHDALETHARDELGMSETSSAKPLQAAIASALTFTTGGAIPLVMALLFPGASVLYAILGASLVALAILGTLGAYAGGASLVRGALRVLLLGGIALAITTFVGHLFKIAA